MSDKILEVGDVIYSDYSGCVDSKYEIDRVTKTLAMVGTMKFKRNVRNGWVDPYPSVVWGQRNYRTPTLDLDNAYRRYGLMSKVLAVRWTQLKTATLEGVLQIIEEDESE